MHSATYFASSRYNIRRFSAKSVCWCPDYRDPVPDPPGIGYTSYEAIIAGDIPFVMFYIVFIAVLTLLGTLIADILYASG